MTQDNKKPYRFANRIIAHTIRDDLEPGFSTLIHLLAVLLKKQDLYRNRVYGADFLDYIERVADKENFYDSTKNNNFK